MKSSFLGIFFCFSFVFLCFFWGFNGQVRWPEGPPHLALNPPYFLFVLFVLFFVFLSLLLIENLFFPLEMCIFCLFLSVSLCFSLASFGLPLFQFILLCLCLSLSLSCSFLCFFPPVFLFCFLLVPCFSLFLCFSLSSLLLFHERKNIKIFNYNCFSSIILFLVFCLAFSFKSLLLVFAFFLILSYVFVQHQWFWFQKPQVEKHQFLVKRGVATKRYYYEPVFWNMWKVIVFLAIFWANFVDFQKTP